MHRPFVTIGGKNRLAKTIIAQFPYPRCYVELFGGPAQITFHQPSSALKTLNDIDKELKKTLPLQQPRAKKVGKKRKEGK